MPPSQRNSSFIPKRNPTQKAKKPRSQRLYLFSLVATALFVASLLASAAVFVYERQAQFNLASAINDFNTAASSFSEADFARVTEFSNRVNTIKQLVSSHVSLVALLAILEQNTAGTAQVTTLTIERSDRASVTASANVITANIDGALFQRDQYKRTPELSATDIAEISFVTDGGGVVVPGMQLPVSLEMTFDFTADEVLYSPTFAAQSQVESVLVEDVEVAAFETEEAGVVNEVDNNNDI